MKFSAARSDLDAMIVEIELTLVSIIQGVALFFLIDNARVVMTTHDIAFCLYIPAGLLVIFVFWSRSILHTLTVVRWPLEFGHNFLYITCALAEALLFTKLSEPRMWFTLSAIYSAKLQLIGMKAGIRSIFVIRCVSATNTSRPFAATSYGCWQPPAGETSCASAARVTTNSVKLKTHFARAVQTRCVRAAPKNG
jgi:hypothetical protein